MVIIKKYSNRRLYDTSQSQYITLDELAAKIREGTDVQVVDAKSGDDLTQVVLTQIIIESRQAAHLLSPQLLTQLIRMEQSTLAEFFGQYMTWALALYQRIRRGAKHLGPLFSPGLTPWGMMASVWEPPPISPPAQAPEPSAKDQAQDGEIAQLREELDELRQMLKQTIERSEP